MALITNKGQYDYIIVDELELSRRACMALHRVGIHTLFQLIDEYNHGKISEIFHLGRSGLEEIECKLDAIKNGDFEYSLQIINEINESNFPKELENISILELKLKNRLLKFLKCGGINTVGDLLGTRLSDFFWFQGADIKTVAEIKDLVISLYEKREDYFKELTPRNDFIDQNNLLDQNELIDDNRLRTIDVETTNKLRKEFGFKSILISEWYGISRQRTYQLLEKKNNRGCWLNRNFAEKEGQLLDELIDNVNFFYETEDGQKAYFFNNKKDDCAVVYVNDNEIKCFFLSKLPEEYRTRIIEKRMECLSEEEFAVLTEGKRVLILREEYFIPNDYVYFKKLAENRRMNPENYCLFLTGSRLGSGHSTIDDNKILKFLHSHYADGKLLIPLNNSTMWFRSFISRHGYSIDEIADLYELDEKFDNGIAVEDINSVEPDMRDYGESDDWIKSVYSRNPLIGNKIISEETREKIYNITKKYVDQILRDPLIKVSMTAKMWITLMVITFAKEWDLSDENAFWRYITAQFGYRDDTGRLRGILCDYLLETLQNNHRWFVLTKNGYRYKATIVVHALATKQSWMRFYDFLFDFYKNNMDWTCVDDDPIVYRMVEVLKKKFVSEGENYDENLVISNKVYSFQEGIRKLVIYRTRYATKLIFHMLRRLDDSMNHKEQLPKLYVDELCDAWMAERINDRSKNRMRSSKSRRGVALDYKRIRPVYMLDNEIAVKIVFPDIRLKKLDFKTAGYLIYSGEEVIDNRSLDFYGNELGKTLSGFDIDVNKCFRNSNKSLNLRVVIMCDDDVVYDSCELLYRELLCFWGEKEVDISSCKKGGYSFFIPSNIQMDFENSEVSEIAASDYIDAYFVRLEDDFIIRKNNNVLVFDNSLANSSHSIRTFLPKVKKEIKYFHNGKKYGVLSEIGSVRIVIGKEFDFNKAILVLNDKRISLMDLDKNYIGDDVVLELPLKFLEDNTCEFEIKDLNDDRILVRAELFYKESLVWDFNRKLYFDETDYEHACFRVLDGDKIYSDRFDSSADIVTINVDSGVYEIKVPRITVRKGNGDEWEKEKIYWIKEFDQRELININYPDNCEVNLMLGDIEVVECKKNIYSFGNAIYSLSTSKPSTLVELTLQIKFEGGYYSYSLGQIATKEQFITSPEFDFKDGNLYWNKGHRFIGDNTSQIKLILSGNNIEKRYFLNLENSLVEENIDIPIGEYEYKIVKESSNIFSLDEEDLAAGSLIIGEKEAFLFKDSIIKLTQITNEERDRVQKVEIRGVYIEDIEYQGIQYVYSEDRECPVYTGILFYMGKSGNHHAFSFEEKNIDGCHSLYKVNPVTIVYINKHTVSITNDDGDGIYYVRKYNRNNMINVYQITDKEPEEFDQENYCLADLFLYEKERI